MTKSNGDKQVTMKKITKEPSHDCKMAIMAVHDAIDVLNGKWKITIITCLLFGPRRYSDIMRDVKGISGKVLSRELKEMETNLLISRSVISNRPITVSYSLTDYGMSVQPIITVLSEWGQTHRKQISKK
ncbi:helix-turn-helix domain-containing protein [Pedobacter jeongneungensis]|uniref:Helix-turn-helix domain-containing protein n=2 Tax=Pedobacter jeongneungensis TaxID=947309 RepID=A0ABP8BC97_9SPHI